MLFATWEAMICLRNGCYDSVPIETIHGRKKSVDLQKYYYKDRLRPKYETFERLPLFIMTSEG